MKKTVIWFAFTTFFLLLSNSCTVNPVTGKKELSLMSRQQELALGQQSDPSIISSFGSYENDPLQKFINEKGSEMVKVSHTPDMEFKFRILDSPVVNAFAVPGGYVYFTRGIMAHFNNEAEFAGVLGHEIGHVTARHSAKQYTNATLAQIGLIAGVVLSEDFRKYANYANTAMQMMLLKFGRDHESQSDRLGVEYSTKIGYDAHEMANFFSTIGRLSGGEGQRLPTFLSTHPNPEDRHQKVGELATKWQAKEGTSKNLQVNRDSYLRMIDGLVYGEDPRQGYVENYVFYHPEMKFQYQVPRGWKTQNTPSQVQMAPESGDAALLLTLAPGNSLQAAAEKFVKDNQLTLVQSKNVKVNGLPAMAIVTDQYEQTQQAAAQQSAAPRNSATSTKDPKSGKSGSGGSGSTTSTGSGKSGPIGSGNTNTSDAGNPGSGTSRPGAPIEQGGSGSSSSPSQQAPPAPAGQTPKLRILTYLIQYNDAIYMFHGLAEYPNFNRFAAQFEQTMKSFRSLSDPAKINVKPDVIHVETVSRTGTLQSTLRSFKVPQNKLEEHAILNGMKLTDAVTKGTLIKVIGK